MLFHIPTRTLWPWRGSFPRLLTGKRTKKNNFRFVHLCRRLIRIKAPPTVRNYRVKLHFQEMLFKSILHKQLARCSCMFTFGGALFDANHDAPLVETEKKPPLSPPSFSRVVGRGETRWFITIYNLLYYIPSCVYTHTRIYI